MSDFWERFNEMARAAETTESGKLFAESNFHVGHNGGGCSAWERPIDDTGWKIMITDSEGFSHDLEDESDHWLVGAHHDDGEFIETPVAAHTVAEALAAADAFHMALSRKPAVHDIQKVIHLAREFGSLIQGALSRNEFRDMVDRNKAEPDDSPICHSHDFCDANVYMAEAFETVFGRKPEPDTVADARLWNDAWQIAKAADFFA